MSEKPINYKNQNNPKIQKEFGNTTGVKEKGLADSSKKSQKFFDIKKEESLSTRSKENAPEASIGLLDTEIEPSIVFSKGSKIFTIENMKAKNAKTMKRNKPSNFVIDLNKEDLLEAYREIKDLKLLGRKRISVPTECLPNMDKESISFKKIEFNPSTTWFKENDLNLKEVFQKTLHNPEKCLVLPSDNIIPKTQIDDRSFPNPYDTYYRLEEANRLHFIRSFQEDYAPIKMQKDNEKIFEGIANGDAFTKTHFIKKKQSAVNIKRQSGVSYVVESESKQVNVEKSYKPLGHLVYQGTHSIQQLSDEMVICHIDDIICKQLMKGPLLVSVFESPDEDEMKQYLLNPGDRFKLTKE
jgi:hypothetical protein